MRKAREFIHELRRSDDARKRRFYYGGVVVSMALVIALWFLYISVWSPLPSTRPRAAEGRAESGISRTFRKGFEAIGLDISRAWGKITGRFGSEVFKTRDIVIEKPEEGFSFPTSTASSSETNATTSTSTAP
jgi:hypothetical protein